MIDVDDLVKHLYDEGKIIKYRNVGQNDIMITCPRLHYRLDYRTGELIEHYEKRPSLGIQREEPYLFNCFGCGFKGTLEFLVAEILGVDLLEAVRWLSHRYDFDEEYYRKINETAIAKLKEYEKLFGEKVSIKTYDESYFSPFRKIHRYTLDRGFTEEIARKYEIGFDEWQRRIVIPMRNEEGKIIGLYGRAIDESNEAKYLYYNYEEGNIVGWDKGMVVYRNKTDVRKAIALVVESGLDVPWADQQGVTDAIDVVSILGSKATERQAELLSRYEEVILGLDNDFAGEQGTKTLVNLLGNRTKVSRIFYPDGVKDLGECEEELIKEMILNRRSVLDTVTGKLKLRFD